MCIRDSSDPQVLRAMEHSALESPHYLPIKVKKDGTIADGVASAAQLGTLGRYVDRLLHQIAREIGSGSIAAAPVAHGPQAEHRQNAPVPGGAGDGAAAYGGVPLPLAIQPALSPPPVSYTHLPVPGCPNPVPPCPAGVPGPGLPPGTGRRRLCTRRGLSLIHI